MTYLFMEQSNLSYCLDDICIVSLCFFLAAQSAV
jgi:hypothetical protein